MHDLIIIGSGPAGMTAAIYAARKKINTLIVSKELIGQVGKTVLIENYPGFSEISGIDFILKLKKQAEKSGAKIKDGQEVKKISKNDNGFFDVELEKETLKAKAIIIATGRNPKKLNIPGEKEFFNKGVSYCVTCDGPLFLGKEVAVVGGGNSGFYAAFELSKYCPKIYIFESGLEVLADKIEQERAMATKKVELFKNVSVKEIKGDKFVRGLVFEDKESGEQKEIAVEGVFIEIGYVAVTDFAKDLISLNEKGEIIIDPKTLATNVEGIFAAGDVTDIKVKQMVVAAGEGAKAALSVFDYLNKITY